MFEVAGPASPGGLARCSRASPSDFCGTVLRTALAERSNLHYTPDIEFSAERLGPRRESGPPDDIP
jgi:hypothetical protein